MTKNDGDPLVTKPISLTQSTWDRIDVRVQASGVSRAKVVRELVEAGLNQEVWAAVVASRVFTEANPPEYRAVSSTGEKTESNLPEMPELSPKTHLLPDCVGIVTQALRDRTIKARDVVPAEMIASKGPATEGRIVQGKKDAFDVEPKWKTPKESKKRW